MAVTSEGCGASFNDAGDSVNLVVGVLAGTTERKTVLWPEEFIIAGRNRTSDEAAILGMLTLLRMVPWTR